MKLQLAIKKPLPAQFILLEQTYESCKDFYEFVYGDRPTTNSSIDTLKWTDYCDSCFRQGYMPLKTLESGEGTQNANFGDYILKGIEGECWPVKPEIFIKTYNILE